MRKTEKYGIISILLALLILCYLDGVILAEKKDKNHNKKNEPAEKNTVTESVEASARNKPAKWDGEAPGKRCAQTSGALVLSGVRGRRLRARRQPASHR